MTAPDLARAFAQHFDGEQPGLVAAAPGRVNLVGEHTDYNEGYVLPFATARVCRVALRQNGSRRHRLVALDRGGATAEAAAGEQLAPHAEQWANYPLGVLAALQQRTGRELPGLDLAVASEVPEGMGLSSSAALTCAVGRGVDALLRLRLDDWALAEAAQDAENVFVGAPTGLLDPFASLFGQRGRALLLDCRSRDFREVPLRLPGHRLVLLDTGVRHNHATGGYAERRDECARAVAQLRDAGWSGSTLRDMTADDLRRFAGALDEVTQRRARFIVAENARVLRAADQLAEGDVTGFGESLLRAHAGLSQEYEVSCAESDAVVGFGERHPACAGARQVGGGFGGCVLCVVAEDEVGTFVSEAQGAFGRRFGTELQPLSVTSGPGARVELRGAERVAAGAALDTAEQPHRRLNILTGEWVLVSPHRARRPWQGHTEEAAVEGEVPSYDPGCYLCPGNARAGGHRNPDYAGTYAFDNDFAALRPPDSHQAQPTGRHDGLLIAEPEAGLCRVLCYSPDHARTLARMEFRELEAVIGLWQAQYAELGALPWVAHVQIFENRGPLMGASNPHPHGQVWAQATVPAPVATKGDLQAAYYAEHPGEHLLSAYLEQEIERGVRVLWHDAHAVALVPWWAVWPFETLVAPRRPQAHVGELEPEERRSVARALAEVTRRYDGLFGVPFPYSLGLHQAPTDGEAHAHWHWHAELKPPLLRSATVRKFMVGYELFAAAQRDLTPEAAAARLRGVEIGGVEEG